MIGRSGAKRPTAVAAASVWAADGILSAAAGIRSAAALAAVVLSPLLIAATGSDGARPAPRPPRLLSQTGLYEGGDTSRVAAGNWPYSPQYPLWSDGARKSRWVSLPPGTTIDATRVDAWVFPVGTKFWKEFQFGGRKVETRFLWKTGEEEWTFAAYEWNEDQTDAVLVPEDGSLSAVEVAPGKPHAIPGTSDCRACHDSARTEILGFNALQLSTDRDPNALHGEPLQPGMIDLRDLVQGRRLTPSHEDLLARPPRIRAASPIERTALGYLSANCGGCHNRESSIASVGLFLKHTSGTPEDASPGKDASREDALVTAWGQPSAYEIPGTEPGSTLRLAPGAPDRSSVLYRMKSRRPSSQMPPLGTAIPDTEAVDLLTRWIVEERMAERRDQGR